MYKTLYLDLPSGPVTAEIELTYIKENDDFNNRDYYHFDFKILTLLDDETQDEIEVNEDIEEKIENWIDRNYAHLVRQICVV